MIKSYKGREKHIWHKEWRQLGIYTLPYKNCAAAVKGLAFHFKPEQASLQQNSSEDPQG